MTTRHTIQSATAFLACALLAAGCFQQSPELSASSTATTTPSSAASSPDEASPSATTAQADGGDTADCIDPTTFDRNKDYFPDKVEFKEAKLIEVEYHNFYKTISITNPDTQAVQKAVLVKCGAEQPDLGPDLEEAKVITVPATRIITPSTTEISNFELLDALDHIGATGATEYISSTKALEYFKTANTPAIANPNGDIDVEQALAVKPDVTLMSGMANDAYTAIAAADVPVLDDNAWLEATPLGRAEWLKFFAVLTNTEAKANTEYNRIETAYNTVKEQVASEASKPTVLAGSVYQGQWYVPGNDSYVAKFIEDAGGSYVMKSAPGGGSEPVDFEKVVAEGGQADIWINAQSSAPAWASTADIIAVDARLGELKAVKDGKVFNPMKKIGPGGGNEYWETGVIQPDVVLHDLAAAFHPDAFTDYEPVYYLNVGK
ncbi:ABC transporter substrate-binding protein [Stomatohabitans albus]|uniref:ABC transporter substrate-binding protein n=1 Tax=Stomatohabitans albus TaxID=3110766 RepID=UPI00300CADB8